MIKKFISGTILFSLSSILFTVVRQLIFFPKISSYNEQLFVQFSFVIILIDVLNYGLSVPIADYYVRKVNPSSAEEGLFYQLQKLTLISIFAIIPMLLFGIDFTNTIILAVYLVLFSKNTLNIKLWFNQLDFKANFVYLFCRTLPYLFILVLVLFKIEVDLTLLSTSLLTAEIISFFYLSPKNVSQNNSFTLDKKEIVLFFTLYTAFAIIQRLDMLVVHRFFEENYSSYFKVINTVLFFVNPIILISGSSLLSILTKLNAGSFINNKKIIIVSILTIALLVSFLNYFFSPFIISALYPSYIRTEDLKIYSSIFVFSSIVYFSTRSFVIKFSNLKYLTILSFSALSIPLVFLWDYYLFLYSFVICRLIVHLMAFSLIK